LTTRKEIAALLRHPLTGFAIKITDHQDPTLIGRAGVIVGDTWQMLKIRIENKICMVNKAQGTYTITTKYGIVKIAGRLLVGDPKKRSKRKLRNW